MTVSFATRYKTARINFGLGFQHLLSRTDNFWEASLENVLKIFSRFKFLTATFTRCKLSKS